MDEDAAKADLLVPLRSAHEALVWKLQGLSELDARRPLLPTGTNLLGLAKHLATVQGTYLGACFNRPFPGELPGWRPQDPVDADLWALPEEERAEVVDRYRRVQAHTEAVVAELPLAATGTVPWWPPPRRHPTLLRALVHVAAEASRHAGHADVLRELVDGAVGLRAERSNLPPAAEAPGAGERWWAEHRARVQAAAEQAQARWPG